MQWRDDHAEATTAKSLVTRIRNGESDAETELIETYRRGLFYQLNRLSRNHALCEDLFQDTFRVVLEKVREGAIREPEKLARFIRKTAQNLYIADYRKRVRRGAIDEQGMAMPPANPPANAQELMEREQEAKLVRQVIHQLNTERDKRILYRFYLAQDHKDVICSDLGIDPKIFNRLLYRARQRFKQLWTTQFGEIQSTQLEVLLLLLCP